MKPLFSKSGQQALQKLLKKKALLAFDFDGTLAAIPKKPKSAEITQDTLALLRELHAFCHLAIISGRSRENLKEKIDFHDPHFVGNHGIDCLLENPKNLQKAQKISRAWIRQLKSAGLLKYFELEDKTYSVSLLYTDKIRSSAHRSRLLKQLTELEPRPHLIKGKGLVNLLPEHAPHKGKALHRLSRHLKNPAVFYIGDEDSDELAFQMKISNFVSVRVGSSKKSAAQFFIPRQQHLNRLLKQMLTLLKNA